MGEALFYPQLFYCTGACINLLLTPSVCALSSRKAFLQFVIIENFMLIVELDFDFEDYYFCISHFKSLCISSQATASS